MLRQGQHFDLLTKFHELRIGSHQRSSQSNRQFRRKAVGYTQLVSDSQDRRVNRDLLVDRNGLNDSTRFVDAQKRLLLPKISREYIKYFGQIHHGDAQVCPP